MSLLNLVAVSFCLAVYVQDTPPDEGKSGDVPVVQEAPLVESSSEIKYEPDISAVEAAIDSYFVYEAFNSSSQTQFGVHVRRADDTLRKHLKIKSGVGLVIELVVPNSGAANAEIKVDDVLVKLDDQWLINAEQFTTLVQNMDVGQAVKATLIREGLLQEVSVTLTQSTAIGQGSARLQFELDYFKHAAHENIHKNFSSADCSKCHQSGAVSGANPHYPANR